MTKSSWTCRSLFCLLLAAGFVLPMPAFASVKIVDAMYDPPGADEGHEWIQLANTESEAVNLAGYRLYEGGTNHKLTVVEGTSSLAAGAGAIIATDPAQYLADHTSFAGTIFKSSFSLSNTGETIELRDSKLAVVDSYTYKAPPVVKVQTVPKTHKAIKAPLKSVPSTYVGNTQAASVAFAPAIPISNGWFYGLGALTILVLGAAAALFMWPEPKLTTLSASEEFELE